MMVAMPKMKQPAVQGGGGDATGCKLPQNHHCQSLNKDSPYHFSVRARAEAVIINLRLVTILTNTLLQPFVQSFTTQAHRRDNNQNSGRNKQAYIPQ